MMKRTSRGANRVSLARALSKLGYCSRSVAFHRIKSGAVFVNGVIRQNPFSWVDLANDRISVDGEQISKSSFRYYLLNKPKGVVTSRLDQNGKKTIYELLESDLGSLNPVGRLDKDTSGLLLLTNNNQLADFLTNPGTNVEKIYIAVLDKPLTHRDMEELKSGVEIDVDGKIYRTKPIQLNIVHDREVQLSLHEGKNRQIRKMFAALGYTVNELQRIAVGPLVLGNLRQGEYRKLTIRETTALLESERVDQ
jgi:23S rRNA pseudouridine2605 synthase